MVKICYRSKAPFRISFSGGGTDVPQYFIDNGGHVLSTTIDKYIHVFAVARNDNKFVIHDYNLNIFESYEMEQFMDGVSNPKLELIYAVVKHFPPEMGLDLYIYSDLPVASGMGTSSSLTVALIALFSLMRGNSLTKREIADLACYIERIELKQAGGYQDQFAAAFGGLNFITFGPGIDKIDVIPLTIDPIMEEEFQERLLLCFTGKTHFSSVIHRDMLKNMENLDYSQAMQKLKDVTLKMKDLLGSGEISRLNEFGSLQHKAWIAKKQLSKKISTNEIEQLYHYSRLKGALGGKILGAGGGGFLLLFVDPTKIMDVRRTLEEHGGIIVDFHFENNGVRAWEISQSLL